MDLLNMSVPLFIAQASSLITAFICLLAMNYVYTAWKRILPGDFKSVVRDNFIFVFLIAVSVFAMAVWHISESFSEPHAYWENLWYFGMFLGLSYSVYASYKLINFGSPVIRVIQHFRAKQKRGNRSKR